jgi:hypothetical protein
MFGASVAWEVLLRDVAAEIEAGFACTANIRVEWRMSVEVN